MVSETRPWDRQPGEPPFWFHRFERYRLLGPDRSLLAAYNDWRIEKGREKATGCPGSWSRARDRWTWVQRAQVWDEHVASEVAARVEAQRIEILSSGFAQQHERVRALKGLATLLLEELQEEDKRWLPDVKAIGSSQEGTFERVDIVRFNAALVKEAREALGDIAEEMGERVKGLQVTGKDGGPLDVAIREVIVNLRHEPEQEPLED